MNVQPVGSAVNYLQIQNAATGFSPGFNALGSDPNISIQFQTKGGGEVEVLYQDSTTNTTDTVFSLYRRTSGTAANNIGAANNFYISTDGAADRLAGGVAVQWTTVTDASRTSRMFFNTTNNASFGERMGLDHNGIRLPEISSAATPAANFGYFYFKDKAGVSTPYAKGDDGTEKELGLSGGGSTNPTNTIVPYNNAGTFADTNLAFSSNVFTQTVTSLGASRADGLVLQNTTAATSGTTQLSQSLRFSSSGYKTTPTAAARTVEVNLDLRPIEQTTNPAYGLQISTQCASCTVGTSFSQHSVFGVALDGTKYTWFPAGGQSGWPGITIGGQYGGTQASPIVSGIWEQGGNVLGLRTASGSTGTIAIHANTTVLSGSCYQFSNNTSSVTSGTTDTFLCRGGAAATMQFGATLTGVANSSTPVAQILQGTTARAGTDSNLIGSSITIQSGTGTGNATPSTLVLRSPVAVASGTGAQTQATGLTITVGTAKLTAYTVTNLPAAATAGEGAMAFVTDATATTTYTTVSGGGSNKVLVISDGTNWIIH